MYLICTKCDRPELKGDAKLYLAKYYPSTGWYPPQGHERPLDERLWEWFERHRHAEGPVISKAGTPCWDNLFGPGRRFGTMFGNEHIRLEFEVEPEGPCQSTSTSA